jgi:ribosomal protein S18 acetylase RimI-like enzyme
MAFWSAQTNGTNSGGDMQASEKATSIKIIWATPQHLDDVWRVQEQSDLKHPHPKSYYEEALQFERLLLAYDGDTPVALLCFEILWGNTAFAALAKVLPDYQRKGIGQSMAEHLEVRLMALGFTSYICSTEDVNEAAKQILPHVGWVKIGELQMAHGCEIFYLKKLP